MANAFADCARQSVITPIARAGFFVRCNVRRNEPGQILIGPDVTRTLAAGDRRRAWLGPISVRVTAKASIHAINQILSTRQARGRRCEFPIRQSALLRADDRAPTDR